MASPVGIIPASGSATRWNAYPKEMLPIGNGTCLIDSAVEALVLAGASRIYVVTNEERVTMQMAHLRRWDDSISIAFLPRKGEPKDIWTAIQTALPFCAEHNLLVMPDTLFPIGALDVSIQHLALWLFETRTPERFGALVDGRIQDKNPLLAGSIHRAWGAVGWSRDVAEFWMANEYERFVEALNEAIDHFGYETFPFDYYYDMATWDDYHRWVSG